MQLIETILQLIETISFLSLIQLSYSFALCYITSNWLAHRGIFSPLFANVIRLLSSVMAVVVVTLMLINHIYQSFLLVQNLKGFFGPALGFLIIPGLYWLIILVRPSGAHLLGAILMMVPLYSFILLVDQDSLLLKFPPLISFMFVYIFPLIMFEFWGVSYYDTLQGFSERLSARYVGYKQILAVLNNNEDKPGLVLSTVCGLTLSILNFLQVYQTCTSFVSYVTLVIIAGSIVFNTALGFGLISIARKVNVNFYYNFVIQIYINFFNNFKRIYYQIKQNQLPHVSLTNFVLTLILALTLGRAPTYGMNHETGSTIELPGASGDGEPSLKKREGQPLGEGQRASKVAKAAQPHIDDIVKRTGDKVKEGVAVAIVAGGAAALYEGSNQVKEQFGWGPSTQTDQADEKNANTSTLGQCDKEKLLLSKRNKLLS